MVLVPLFSGDVSSRQRGRRIQAVNHVQKVTITLPDVNAPVLAPIAPR
jgi:hypothetical protein